MLQEWLIVQGLVESSVHFEGNVEETKVAMDILLLKLLQLLLMMLRLFR